MSRLSRLADRPDSFGWISIALHWLTAVVIVILWGLGRSIEFQAPEAMTDRRTLHVTLGLLAWLLLAGRIVWRLRNSHPRAVGQSAAIHKVAMAAHYLMLGLLSVMLVSGPLLALTLTMDNTATVAAAAHTIHNLAANLLAILVILHIAGAFKHLMFNDDETLARIFTPGRRDSAVDTDTH